MAGSVGEVSWRVGRLSGCQGPHPARFEHFDRVCVAFSSARDSSVLLRPARDRARSVHAFVRNCQLESVKIDRSILDPNPNFPYSSAGLLVALVDLCARVNPCAEIVAVGADCVDPLCRVVDRDVTAVQGNSIAVPKLSR